MINEERVRKGIAALRSGEFKKTKGRMKKGECFCALGVFSEIYRRETGQGKWIRRITGDCFNVGAERSATELPYAVMSWYGFDESDPCIYYDEDNIRWSAGISTLNDGEGLSFNQIADRLESFLDSESFLRKEGYR